MRRAVLGEIKEKPEGGLYYTKPYRALMNEVTAAEEFLTSGLHGERVKNESAFYGLLLSFYRAGTHIEHMHARVAADADADLARLHETVTKEIADLRRYKLVRGDKEVETYADRIAHRGALLKEIDAMRGCVARIEELFTGFCEFF